MSKYSVKKYMDKKWNDILMNTNVMKAYNLGIATGTLEAYRSCRDCFGKETADKIYSECMKGDGEFNKIFRTLVELDNQEHLTTAERIAEKLEECKKPDKELSDDDMAFIEKFMEFLYQKQQKKKQ